MTKTTLEVKTFEEIYNDLNETKKGVLRTAFLKEHGYSINSDTFYKKLRGDTFLRPNEQRWICTHLNITAESISFPTRD